MTSCSCSKSPARKKGISRFKGIETLLRRIAFNLGNSPSQTEVKIISCIPIDVTDLQLKIQCLEKQLEKLQCAPCCDDKDKKAVLPLLLDRIAYTNASTKDTAGSTQPSALTKSHKHKHRRDDFSRYLDDYEKYKNNKVKKSLSRDELQSETRNVFGQIIPVKDRTRLVYYAQTTGSPFREYKKVTKTKKDNPEIPENTMNAEYLQSIIERQHLVKMYMDDDMLGSQGSAPVCRDKPRCSRASDDMCSCCRGNFLDVDCKIRKRPVFDPNIDNGNVYYDSSLYDVKPVREKPRLKRNELIKKRTPEMNLLFYPEYYRFSPEYSLNSRKPVKLQKQERPKKPVYIANDSSVTDGLVEFSHVYPKRLSPKQGHGDNKDIPEPKHVECNILSRNTTEFQVKTSKPIQMASVIKLIPKSNVNEPCAGNVACVQPTNNIQCPAEALQTSSLSKFGSTHATLKVSVKNAACLAIPVHEIECQTDLMAAHSDLAKALEPDKTESTLNQIKTMLETVLTEVKTNTTSGLRVINEKETKDAIVQNDPVSSTEGERVLNSFTYSPYAMINPYVPSCSHPLGSYRSSMMRPTLIRPTEVPLTLNYAQNFPELVHPTLAAHTYHPERNMVQPKQMSTCATNTMHESSRRRTAETENLIKEIYKSMKLDVEYPGKTASRSAMNDAKSKNDKTSPGREAPKKTIMGREEMIFRGDIGNRRVPRMENPSESSLNVRQKRRGGSLHKVPTHTTSAQRRQCSAKKLNKEPTSTESKSDSDDEPSVSHTIAPSQPAKKSFFGKVMSSVVSKIRKKGKPQYPDKNANTQDSETSDEAPAQRDRPVKHVSYAPAERDHSSKTCRLGQSMRPSDPPMHQPQRVPRYVPRSAVRPHSGSSQVRRAIYRPPPPHRPRTPPEHMKRPNQYDWRTTTRPAHRTAPESTNDYQPKLPARSQGLKITNKTWMRKPVYHLGFACGPEKEKIMMQ